MNDHQQSCIQEGRYDEAELTRERIEEMKKTNRDKQLEAMMLKHQNDRLELEEEETKFLGELHQEQQQKLETKRQMNEEAVQKQLQDHQMHLE